MGRTFFRIIRGREPSLDDFKSHRALGLPLLEPAFEREWSEGISVYDAEAYAIRRAIKTRHRLGAFVVPLNVPEDGTVEYRQTGTNRRHYTIYGRPEDLIALVSGSARPAKEN